MSRISPIDRNTTNDSVRKNFDAIQTQLGVVPNMMRTMAQSAPVLDAYLGFAAALRRGRLPVALHEQIALAVAEANGCNYCLAAHTLLGKGAGLNSSDILAARAGEADNPRAAAALALARQLVERRGAIGADGIAAARAASLSDADIVEIIASVAINVFTNYVNIAADTDIDFPPVEKLPQAA